MGRGNRRYPVSTQTHPLIIIHIILIQLFSFLPYSIKDIIFSAEVAASLSSAAQQKRIGESKVIAARAEVDAARLMRQAADILASPAAMQIRQLEALQAMAKTSQSKVVFVPMQLQSDIVGGVASGSGSGGAGPSGSDGEGSAIRAGLLNSMSDI